MSTAIDVRVATAEELPLVLEILAEAAAWLSAKGIDQWPSPPNIHWERRMAAAIEWREVYTAGFAKDRFAIVRLTWSDPYWSDDDRAGYVHSMAIRSDMHGRGVGAVIWNGHWRRSESKGSDAYG